VSTTKHVAALLAYVITVQVRATSSPIFPGVSRCRTRQHDRPGYTDVGVGHSASGFARYRAADKRGSSKCTDGRQEAPPPATAAAANETGLSSVTCYRRRRQLAAMTNRERLPLADQNSIGHVRGRRSSWVAAAAAIPSAVAAVSRLVASRPVGDRPLGEMCVFGR
jgi:hypothetical protein